MPRRPKVQLLTILVVLLRYIMFFIIIFYTIKVDDCVMSFLMKMFFHIKNNVKSTC